MARYWTRLFTFFVFLSYIAVYPFFILYPLFDLGIGTFDVAQFGVAYAIFQGATFWFAIIICNLVTFGHRYIERGAVWLFRPQVCPYDLLKKCPKANEDTIALPKEYCVT